MSLGKQGFEGGSAQGLWSSPLVTALISSAM